jgi:signal transduction histidine kinase
MTHSQFICQMVTRTIALLAVLTCCAFLLSRGHYLYAVVCALPAVGLSLGFYRMQTEVVREVEDFAAAARYRDFTRHYGSSATQEAGSIHRSFNELNSIYKTITREKVTQTHYLQNILELVNTGILSYSESEGDVLWLNEGLKKLLGIPYLKNICGLSRRYPELAHQLEGLRPDEQKVATLQTGTEMVRVLLAASVFQADGKRYKLIAFQNVSYALDETESRAWQKLLSVMTHEIMNSIAPISSLADTLQQRLAGISGDDSTTEDLRLGINTIKSRSAGLLKFATTYRNLSRTSTPELRPVLVRDLFETIYRLMQPTLAERGIVLEIVLVQTNLTIQADVNLMEQVLINLVLNAVDAVKDSPRPMITLSAVDGENGRVTMKVIDNGEGVEPELLDSIFIPFFTTKKAGSGIGLSLCKQIMLLHQGSIQVQSQKGTGTAISLVC